MQHSVQTVEGQRAVWLAPEVEIEIVGESFNREHLRRLVGEGRANRGPQLVAWLMPEPTNPHDRNAVMVWLGGGRVGHLARGPAALWQPEVIALRNQYQAPVACLAEIRASSNLDACPGVWLRVPQDAPVEDVGFIVSTSDNSGAYEALAKSRRGIWGNQKELGEPLGLSAVGVGRALIKLGLRDQITRDPTLRAKEEGFAVYDEYYGRYLWNLERVRPLLTAR